MLITGGTGTFGNAVLRRFLATDIGEIRIFSRDEKKQHDMRLAYGNNRKLKFYIGDVRRAGEPAGRHVGRRFCLPRGRAQAGALVRVLPHGGAADQRGGRRKRDERGRGGRGQERGRAQHRQGRLSHQRDGHLQGDDGEAGRGQVARGRGSRLRHQHHPLRQCHGLARIGHPAVRRANQGRCKPLTVTDPEHDPLHDEHR